jgi:hypothetical protein
MEPITIALLVINTLLIVVGFFGANWIYQVQKTSKENSVKAQTALDRAYKIENNYNQKFARLELAITGKLEVNQAIIIERIDKLRDHMDDKFVTKEVCQNSHLNSGSK